MFRALAATLTAPTSATTLFGRARFLLGIAPLRPSVAEKASPPPSAPAPLPNPAAVPTAAPTKSTPPLPLPIPLPSPAPHRIHIPTRPDALLVQTPFGVAQLAPPPPGRVGPPLIPPGPLWAGDPDIVPEPGTLRGSVPMASAAFAGGQLWAAIAGTYAAQVRSTNATREQLASSLRGDAWKVAFMARHPQHFAHNPGGARTAQQFHVGIWAIPTVRRAAFAELDEAPVPVEWFPWFEWGPSLRPLPDTPGYCYLELVPVARRPAALAALGEWPTAGDVSTWFEYREKLPFPAPFHAIEIEPGPPGTGGGAKWHIVPADTPGAREVELPRTEHVGLLRPGDFIGGDGGGPAGPRIPLEVRWVLGEGTNRALRVADTAALRVLTREWRSIRLETVEARLVGDEAGATLYVGIASTATAPTAGAGGVVRPDAVFACDTFASVDTFATGVGRVAVALDVPAHIRRELSAHAPAADACPPVVVVAFDTAGAAHAIITLRLTVGEGALRVIVGPENL